MRRCLTARLTFQRLLCGDASSLNDATAAQKAAQAFRTRYPLAPVPVPIGAALGRSYLLQGKMRRAVALLASHPSARALAEATRQLLAHDCSVDADALLQFVDAVRPVSSVISCDFLGVFAGRLARAGKTQEVKQRLLRDIREAPHLAGTLLRSLTELSDPANLEDRHNVAEAMNIALAQSFVSPMDYGPVLLLLSRGGEHRKVLALWSWMRHSSARWDQTAASAVIISASLSRKMNVAIAVIQSLAEANEDPTIEAQKHFIQHLASRFPPLPRYADQLVTHWHTDAQLWATGARVVGVELLFAYYHVKEYEPLRDWLIRAATNAATEEAKQAILRVKGIPYIMRHFASSIAEEPWLEDFYVAGMHMEDLGEYPQLLGLLSTLARHRKAEEELMDAIRGLQMSVEAFDEMATFVADDIFFRNAEDTLQFIHNMAEALSQQVPTNVRSWLQLLGQG
ncbi:hypothetical protein TraAM80_07259 [Trypanosoma rangeli]|uniref:Uncharacterized protein n=1 Tax=Trypanosoma rangeli TaxID=5698 RepID=A0A3S5IQL9_TRYRA|nr:uncharacterized protein TraAM80_07259 [Trypanosoma rangeli]RNF01046.1 hypothetical protein TraAM80_07259 [Trypanosoma rangeli]|eukprot:RNF01046.1 hypothetical protein TraAM80_07259 [Trypanosoma rangeli]